MKNLYIIGLVVYILPGQYVQIHFQCNIFGPHKPHVPVKVLNVIVFLIEKTIYHSQNILINHELTRINLTQIERVN